MLRSSIALLLGLVTGSFCVQAQDQAPSNPARPEAADGHTVMQTFDGTGTTTTKVFTVPDKWEVRWRSPEILSITVYAPDHTVVAATMGIHAGSFFLASGGTYYLQIEGSGAPDDSSTATPTPAPPASDTPTPPAPPTASNTSTADNTPASTDPYFKWKVEVIELAAGNSDADTNKVVKLPSASDSLTTAAGRLTDDQARAVVLISGDNGGGTGFLIKTADGPAVVTNLHVISNNPNLKILTKAGEQIPMLSAKGASDRDLALLSIQDNHYSYLQMSPHPADEAQVDDEVITPGNSEGGGVVLDTVGKILGIGPQRIEFDNPIYHGNSGGPILDTKTGRVVGVATEGVKVDVGDDLDKASFASRNSAITGSVRYFGLRLDTVPEWVPIDWNRFQLETSFLDQFHLESRNLDAYLNPPSDDEVAKNPDVDSKPYMNDKKIMQAHSNYVRQASGNDSPQQLQAFKELLFELTSIADTDASSMLDMHNFYSFDQARAKDEAAYRAQLKSELDTMGSDISRMNGLVRRVNDKQPPP